MAHDLEAARRELGLSYLDVWIDYFALGARRMFTRVFFGRWHGSLQV